MQKIAAFSAMLLLAGCHFGAPPQFHEFTARFTGDRTELFYQGEKWGFDKFVKAELAAHPEMECVDLVKFCCQAARGIDNVYSDDLAKFNQDFAAALPEKGADLIRVTSPDTARVNLGAWKAAGLPGEWLFRMSAAESSFDDSKEKLDEYLDIAEKAIPESNVKFTAAEFREAAKKYLLAPDHTHQHHSDAYRENSKSYRVISSRYFHAVPVLKKAAGIQADPGKKIIAIDGRSASGKTTLASQLKLILNAQVIHMDDFFLPPPMRTKMRYEQPGGNVHYERFKEEVVPHLKRQSAFSYRIFDCKKQAFNGNRMIWGSDWLVVEGAYSLHPEFGNYAQLKIFYDITPEEQLRRIYTRNGAEAAESFRTRWIPLEEKYIDAFKVREHADLVLK